MLMLWLGKLYIVGVTVDVYAMVGVSARSVKLRSENARSEKNVVPKTSFGKTKKLTKE